MRPRLAVRSAAVIGASISLLAVGLSAAPTASAATGDISEFGLVPGATQPQAIASDADGGLWITLRGSGVLAKAGLDGSVQVAIAGDAGSNPDPDGIALGSDKRMWFTEEGANRISAVTTASSAVQAFSVLGSGSRPRGIASGPDGALWFTQFGSNQIGRITTAGVITEFDLASGSGPSGIVAGPDGALWFTNRTANSIGRITTAGVVTTFALPSSSSQPLGITVGPDNNLWFTQYSGNRIGRITPAGLIAEFSLPTAGSQPNQITAGADKNLWFTETATNKVARITPAGAITEFAIPSGSTAPIGITSGFDGNIWITESANNRFARVLTGATPVSTAAPVLSGASTAVGQTLTTTSGTWSWRPTSYSYQWQRCSTADASSCVAIPGATNATYVIVTADAAQRVRTVVSATNLNGAAATAASSALLGINGLPPAPIPTPVVGGQTVTIAAGVTATLKGPSSPRRTRLLNYSVTMSNSAVRGTVRISIIDSTGREVRVIAAKRAIKANGVARRLNRVTRFVAPGQYTLRAIFTPAAAQNTTYAVATMTKPINVRR